MFGSFGSTSTFGATSASTGFGAPAPAVGWGSSSTPTAFASTPAKSGFGSSTNFSGGSFGFGAPAPQTGFGAPAPSTGFGAPAPTLGFGAPAPQTGFGAPAPSLGFGAPAPQSGFGAPTPSTGFGASSSLFGTNAPMSSLFGQAPAPAVGFGSFQQPSSFPGGNFGSTFGANSAQGIGMPAFDADTLYEKLPQAIQDKVKQIGQEIQKQRRVAEELSQASDHHIKNLEKETALLKRWISEAKTSEASALSLAVPLKAKTSQAVEDAEHFGRGPANLLHNPSGLQITNELPSPYLKKATSQMEETAKTCFTLSNNILQQMAYRQQPKHKKLRPEESSSSKLVQAISVQQAALIQVAGKLSATDRWVNKLRSSYQRTRKGENVFLLTDRMEAEEEAKKQQRQLHKNQALLGQHLPQNQASSASGFGMGNAPAASSLFGPTPSTFGGNTSASGFGSIGGSTAANNFGAFGSSNNAGFGSTALVPAPGGTAPAPGAFGGGFGSSSNSGFGGFGSSAASGFGTGSTKVFGGAGGFSSSFDSESKRKNKR